MPSDLNDTTGSKAGSGSDDPTGADAGTEGDGDGGTATDRSVARENRESEGLGGSLLVVGSGAVGRWLASALAPAETAFCDVDPEAASEAVAAVGGRVVEPDAEERFDVVAIAVPIPAAATAIAVHAPRAERAIVDVTGTMREPVAAMAEHAPEVERLSLHPLFAPEHAPGTVAMVADSEDWTGADGDEAGNAAPGDSVTAAIETSLQVAGNEVFRTTPAEHDRAMETVQARTHAAVLAFALAAEPIDERFHTPVSRTLSAIAARVTGGDPGTYAEIQDAFAGRADVAAAAARIADADSREFEALYREAGDSL